MKKFENFCNSLVNLKDIYEYEEPYGNVEMTGLVGLFEVCFEQSWKAMKEILEKNGFAERKQNIRWKSYCRWEFYRRPTACAGK